MNTMPQQSRTGALLLDFYLRLFLNSIVVVAGAQSTTEVKTLSSLPQLHNQISPDFGASGRLTQSSLKCSFRSSETKGGPQIVKVNSGVSSNNSLIVNIGITVNRESNIYVQYESSDHRRFRSAAKPVKSTDTVSIMRLRPETSYCYQVVAKDSRGRTTASA